MRLEFLGAAHTVTGSCYLLETGEDRYLIDCGMFQGSKRIREYNYEEFSFNPADIDGVLLTHAHVDHCGLVPKLVREGFKGTVYATQATCDLAKIMLPDSAHIQESDAEMLNRKGQRRGDAPVEPLYGINDALDALKQFSPVPYDQELHLSDNLRVFFRDAGHILGSAILEVYVKENGKETKLVFSGDLGQPDQPILRDPTIIHGADFVITESTYGDRRRSSRSSMRRWTVAVTSSSRRLLSAARRRFSTTSTGCTARGASTQTSRSSSIAHWPSMRRASSSRTSATSMRSP